MITQEYLKKVLLYKEDTGLFIWKVQLSSRGKVGTVAGTVTKAGYRVIRLQNFGYLAHRLAVLYMEGTFPTIEVDHKNGIKSDNTWTNLRQSTKSQNSHNVGRLERNTSGVKGLSYCEHGFWKASIMYKGIRYSKIKVSSYNCQATKDFLTTWLKETRESLHREFTNHGIT